MGAGVSTSSHHPSGVYSKSRHGQAGVSGHSASTEPPRKPAAALTTVHELAADADLISPSSCWEACLS